MFSLDLISNKQRQSQEADLLPDEHRATDESEYRKDHFEQNAGQVI